MPKAKNAEAGPDIILDDAPVTNPHVSKAVEKRPEELVKVRIAKFGDGKVSTGEHVAGEGDRYAAHGDVLTVSVSVAEKLEAVGFAEIE